MNEITFEIRADESAGGLVARAIQGVVFFPQASLRGINVFSKIGRPADLSIAGAVTIPAEFETVDPCPTGCHGGSGK